MGSYTAGPKYLDQIALPQSAFLHESAQRIERLRSFFASA
jgi:hypothetical protein